MADLSAHTLRSEENLLSKLVELRGKLEAKQKELADVFTEAGDDLNFDNVKSLEGDSQAKVEWIRTANLELDVLFDQVKEAQTIEEAQARTKDADEYLNRPAYQPMQFPDSPEAFKSFGELIMESKAVTGKAGPVGPTAEIDVDFKTLMTTSAGWAPDTVRGPRVVDIVTRPVQLLDRIPQTTTGQTSVVYMQETTFTNAAAEASEAGTYAESALALTEASDPVRKIATFLPVTDEQLEDVSQAQGYINNRLPFMLRQRLDGQVLNGDGIAPNLDGILNRSGIQTQAKGADPTPDAVHKAITLVRVTGRAEPDLVVMHSNDWQQIRLLRTLDGIYIWGSPADAAAARIWGLPVAMNEAIAEGTALVGDFGGYSELAFKRGIEVQISNSHSTYFIEGKQAVRADVRVALVTYRNAAFCTVTGI